MANGIIHGLPLEEYVNDPAPEPSLSHGCAHALLTYSPKHAWVAHPRLNPDYQAEESSRLDLGSIVHCLLLENDRSRIVVVDAPDWRTKAAKEARDQARAVGRLPILADKMLMADAMVAAARDQIAISELAGVFDAGEPEVTFVWQDGTSWCRTRPDWMTDDGRLLLDFKSTDAAAQPDAWGRGVMVSQGYELQAALGRRAMRAVLGVHDVEFVFLVQETEPPFALSLVGLQPAYWAYADARLDLALEIWSECRAKNEWPAYPTRVAYVEPPTWLTYRLEEQAVMAGMRRDRVEGSTDEL